VRQQQAGGSLAEIDSLLLKARRLIEFACLGYVFTVLSALFYLHYWYVFSANQPSCLALQTASVLKAACGPVELDRLDILLTNSPLDSYTDGSGYSFWQVLSPWKRLNADQAPATAQSCGNCGAVCWPRSRLEFAYAPNEGVL